MKIDLKKMKEGDMVSITIAKRHFRCQTISGNVHKFTLEDKIGLEEVAYNERTSVLVVHKEEGPITRRISVLLDDNGFAVKTDLIESQKEIVDDVEYIDVSVKLIKRGRLSSIFKNFEWKVIK